jgi:hypothetical protein
MFTSKLDYSFYVTGNRRDYRTRTAPLSHRTYILRLTRLLASQVLPGHNGELQLPLPPHKVLRLDLQQGMVGADISPRYSIRSQAIHMTTKRASERLLHLDNLVRDMSNYG